MYTSQKVFELGQRVLQQKRKCQKGVDQVSDSCDSYDLTISLKKIEVVYQYSSTWKALQGAYHHSERTTTASGRQVHLPWKHTV